MQHQATAKARRNAPVLRTGMKFRRQHPLGPYVLDFACLEPKLAIEIDGSQHLIQTQYDHERDAWLAAQGYLVLRFHANQTLSNTEGVLSQILAVLRSHRRAPTPARPQRGREPIQRSKP